jgi:hypothetical protein
MGEAGQERIAVAGLFMSSTNLTCDFAHCALQGDRILVLGNDDGACGVLLVVLITFEGN